MRSLLVSRHLRLCLVALTLSLGAFVIGGGRLVSAAPQRVMGANGATPSPQDNCPKAPDSTPFLDFCSPQIDGQFEGPNGVKITATAKNFQPTQLFLLNFDPNADPDVIKNHCLNGEFYDQSTTRYCYPIQASPLNVTDFSFTFHAQTHLGDTLNSLILAGIIIADPNKPEVVTSKDNFLLISFDPFCLSLTVKGSDDTSSPCRSSEAPQPTVQVISGQTLHLHGENWSPQVEGRNIALTFTCSNGATCKAPPQPSAIQWQDNAFDMYVPIVNQNVGSYTVAVKYILTSGASGNSYVGNAMEIDFPLQVVAPTLQISAGTDLSCTTATPSSCSMSTDDMLKVNGSNFLKQPEHIDLESQCSPPPSLSPLTQRPTGGKGGSPPQTKDYPMALQPGSHGNFTATLPLRTIPQGTYSICINYQPFPGAPTITVQKPGIAPAFIFSALSLLCALASLALYVGARYSRPHTPPSAKARQPRVVAQP